MGRKNALAKNVQVTPEYEERIMRIMNDIMLDIFAPLVSGEILEKLRRVAEERASQRENNEEE